MNIYEFIQRIGLESVDYFWFPLLIWTFLASIIFLGFRVLRSLNPSYHYHLRAALLIAFPFGLLASYGTGLLQYSTRSSLSFDPTVFSIQKPLTFTLPELHVRATNTIEWLEPNFLLGLLTASLFLIALVFVGRLCAQYLTLKKLYRSLDKSPLSGLMDFEHLTTENITVAFHNLPLVPFTFGWRRPVIALPKNIQDDPEKIRMAVHHELVHIQRGDYVLQLFIALLESLFWFHPLFKLGSREIEIYREISCDQEVLNSTGISLKKYASMLYELLPLQRGIGSFSVSMAVQQSTLKKRIQTMKHHNMHQTSIKRSLLFLFIMILGVTLPIACSDLDTPNGLTEEAAENITISLDKPLLTVNGVLSESSSYGTVTGIGNYSIILTHPDYGILKFAPIQFAGAEIAGTFNGNKAVFTVNELDIEVESMAPILSINDDVELWAQHVAQQNLPFTIAASPAYKPIVETMAEMKSFLQKVNPGSTETSKVVETMPKLIGGLASIMSKVVYPEEARKAGVEGRVVVQFIVNEEGTVVDPVIVKGIGSGCDEAAIEAVRNAKFEPGLQDNTPVAVQYSLPIVFRLNS